MGNECRGCTPSEYVQIAQYIEAERPALFEMYARRALGGSAERPGGRRRRVGEALRLTKLGRVLAVVLVLSAAGCVLPATPEGNVTFPHVEKTAPDSPEISLGCRAALKVAPYGQDILNEFDVEFGYWAVEGDPPAEVANTMNSLATTASRVAHVAVCP